jgi:hypothetical protein
MMLINRKVVQGLFWIKDCRPLKAVLVSTAAGILLTHQLTDPLHKDSGLLLESVHHTALLSSSNANLWPFRASSMELND